MLIKTDIQITVTNYLQTEVFQIFKLCLSLQKKNLWDLLVKETRCQKNFLMQRLWYFHYLKCKFKLPQINRFFFVLDYWSQLPYMPFLVKVYFSTYEHLVFTSTIGWNIYKKVLTSNSYFPTNNSVKSSFKRLNFFLFTRDYKQIRILMQYMSIFICQRSIFARTQVFTREHKQVRVLMQYMPIFICQRGIFARA